MKARFKLLLVLAVLIYATQDNLEVWTLLNSGVESVRMKLNHKNPIREEEIETTINLHDLGYVCQSQCVEKEADNPMGNLPYD